MTLSVKLAQFNSADRIEWMLSRSFGGQGETDLSAGDQRLRDVDEMKSKWHSNEL